MHNFNDQDTRAIVQALRGKIYLDQLTDADFNRIEAEAKDVVRQVVERNAAHGRSLETISVHAVMGLTGQHAIAHRLAEAGLDIRQFDPSITTDVDMIVNQKWLEVKHQNVFHNVVSFSHSQLLETMIKATRSQRLDYFIAYKMFLTRHLEQAKYPDMRQFVLPWMMINMKTFESYLALSKDGFSTYKFYMSERARQVGECVLLNAIPDELQPWVFKQDQM